MSAIFICLFVNPTRAIFLTKFFACAVPHIFHILVKTLRRSNNLAIIITRHKVIQLAAVLHILILVALAIVKAPFTAVISVPPKLIHWHLIFYNAVVTTQPVLTVHLSIRSRRSHPVAIAQLALLHRAGHSTVHLHLRIFLTTPYCSHGIIYRVYRLHSSSVSLHVLARLMPIILVNKRIPQSNVLHIHIRSIILHISPARCITLIPWVRRCHPCTHTLVLTFSIAITLAAGSLVKHLTCSSIVTTLNRLKITPVKFLFRQQTQLISTSLTLCRLLLGTLSGSLHNATFTHLSINILLPQLLYVTITFSQLLLHRAEQLAKLRKLHATVCHTHRTAYFSQGKISLMQVASLYAQRIILHHIRVNAMLFSKL